MDIVTVETTALEVKDQWLDFRLNHVLTCEDKKFQDRYYPSGYVQSVFFLGDKDGNPVSQSGPTQGMIPTRTLDPEKLEAMLVGMKVTDGRTVKAYLIEALNALAKEA